MERKRSIPSCVSRPAHWVSVPPAPETQKKQSEPDAPLGSLMNIETFYEAGARGRASARTHPHD